MHACMLLVCKSNSHLLEAQYIHSLPCFFSFAKMKILSVLVFQRERESSIHLWYELLIFCGTAAKPISPALLQGTTCSHSSRSKGKAIPHRTSNHHDDNTHSLFSPTGQIFRAGKSASAKKSYIFNFLLGKYTSRE